MRKSNDKQVGIRNRMKWWNTKYMYDKKDAAENDVWYKQLGWTYSTWRKRRVLDKDVRKFMPFSLDWGAPSIVGHTQMFNCIGIIPLINVVLKIFVRVKYHWRISNRWMNERRARRFCRQCRTCYRSRKQSRNVSVT